MKIDRLDLETSPRLASLSRVHPWLDRFERLQRPLQAALIAGLIVLLGIIDAVTGFEISFSIFYLLPVSLAAWSINRQWGLITAFVCATVWMISEMHAGRNYDIPFVHVWNALVRAGFFVIVVVLLTSLRGVYRAQVALTHLDALTGLFNSRAFYRAAEDELRIMVRSGSPLTVAYLDLDNFKHVNDTQGHMMGDNVLRLVGRLMNSELRLRDVPARLGGDEFALLLPGTDRDSAESSMQRLQRDLCEQMNEHGWPVTFSMGLVTYTQAPASVEAMVHQADELMYEVKKSGKNKIVAIVAA